jgi:hypothetical protein
MTKIGILAAAVAAGAIAAPATAAVIITASPGAVQPAENVLADTSMTAATVFGTTNQTNTSVSIMSMNAELLSSTTSNGQSRFISTDGSLDFARVFLTQGGSFTEAEFNLFGALAGTTAVDITVSGIINGVQSSITQNFALGNGENFLGFQATGGDVITSIAFNTNGDGVTDLRQLRVGGVSAVPEPATWAMMLIGFGAVGYSMRRRKVGYSRIQAA